MIISIYLAESDLILQITDKIKWETDSIDNREAINLVELAVVAEPEFQYRTTLCTKH